MIDVIFLSKAFRTSLEGQEFHMWFNQSSVSVSFSVSLQFYVKMQYFL